MIETERLILRPFTADDAADLYEYLKEPGAHCFTEMKLASPQDAEEEIKRRMNDELYFAIVPKDVNRAVGEIFVHSEPNERKDMPDDTFFPCWMLNLKYSGRGYAYEAASAVFDYLFRNRGARRIYAYADEDNLRSRHLCEKLGMRQEGIFLEYVSFVSNPDGTPHYENTYQFALLRSEWEKMHS